MPDPSVPEGDYDPSQVVSYSSMTLHRQCPQAWAYKYIRGLEADTPRYAPDLGSWWHLLRAMDSLNYGFSLGSIRQSPKHLDTGNGVRLPKDRPARPNGQVYRLPNGKKFKPSVEIALALSRSYWRTLSGEARDEWIAAIGEPLPDRLDYMNATYQARWKSERSSEYPLAVECWIRNELGPHLPTTPAFVGTVDLIYQDAARGDMIVIRDHKTGNTLPGADAEADLSDSQLHLYAWAAQELVEQWSGDYRVQAISYDRVRSSKPKQPSLTQSGNLSKSVTDYDLRTYLAFARGPEGNGVEWGTPDTYVKTGKNAGAPKFGTYLPEDSIIEHLSTPASLSVWHQRSLTPLNGRIVDSHYRSLKSTQAQAEQTLQEYRENGEAPRNFTRWGCKWCEFRRLCQAEMTGGPGGDYPLSDYGLISRNH